jgi:hypothetical protein
MLSLFAKQKRCIVGNRYCVVCMMHTVKASPTVALGEAGMVTSGTAKSTSSWSFYRAPNDELLAALVKKIRGRQGMEMAWGG